MRYRAPHSIRTKLTPILHHSTFLPQTSRLHTPDAFSDRRAGVERLHLLAAEIRHVCCLFSTADAVGCDLKGGLNNYLIIHELPCLGVNNYKRSLIKEALLFLLFFFGFNVWQNKRDTGGRHRVSKGSDGPTTGAASVLSPTP